MFKSHSSFRSVSPRARSILGFSVSFAVVGAVVLAACAPSTSVRSGSGSASASSTAHHASASVEVAAGAGPTYAGAGTTGRTRTYYVQAVEEQWNYAPEGMNVITGKPFTEDEQVFVAKAKDRIGSTYLKCLYRGYTDATFTTPIEQPAYMGFLGPTIRAEVGDKLEVVFKNSCSFANTIHVHGLPYDKKAEGAPYTDGTTTKADDDVRPGQTYTYRYEVPESAGPGPMDPSSAMWMYHSHFDEVGDVYAGLTGFLIVTAHGKAKEDGSPQDVDGEYFSLFEVVNENLSTLIDANIKISGVEPADPGDFEESNLMHSINGFVYGNGPMPTMRQGDKARWYLMGMGNEVDLHTPHWHANTVLAEGMRTDVVELMPGTMVTADMQADDPGIWLYHCHVADHISAGMIGRYEVKPA